jgi:hypothetical protein
MLKGVSYEAVRRKSLIFLDMHYGYFKMITEYLTEGIQKVMKPLHLIKMRGFFYWSLADCRGLIGVLE